jgi:hypothetical protein
MNATINRLKLISYQLQKTYNTSGWVDADFIEATDRLVNAQLDDLTQLVDTQMPAALFSCTLNWPYGPMANDSIYVISKNTSEIIQDATQLAFPESTVFNPVIQELSGGYGDLGLTSYLGAF